MQGAPGLRPVNVLQGKLLEPSMVFMFRKVTSSDLESVTFLKYSFAFCTSTFPFWKRLRKSLWVYMNFLQKVIEGNRMLSSSLVVIWYIVFLSRYLLTVFQDWYAKITKRRIIKKYLTNVAVFILFFTKMLI